MARLTGAAILCFWMGCRPDGPEPKPWEGEDLPGGQVTVFDHGPNAFSHAAPAISGLEELEFFVGNSFFNQNWVEAPASTTARDGLGPLFNARSCSGCHFKDGRGRAPEFPGELSAGYLVRLSIAGFATDGGPLADPVYGGQLQDQAIQGVPVEAAFHIQYTEQAGTFPDGEAYSLRMPIVSFFGENYGPLRPDIQTSSRVANQMIGLGLLEAVPEAAILVNEDPHDANGDGISGRANRVWDVVSGSVQIGRFGWKANQPNLLQQTAGAFVGDMGITSSLFPDENCTMAQGACQSAANGGSPEITPDDLGKVLLYVSALAVPARRGHDDSEILRGRDLFMQIGCGTCHQPSMKTGSHAFDFLENQTIWPYTDLLLHDMGPGLSDNRPDFEASGYEWRTPPLWGIGLLPIVNGHSELLHDGRARNVQEAILWHGGEGEVSKMKFTTLTSTERKAIIAFIHSL